MKPETLIALKASIEHWKRNVEAETHEEVHLGWRSCPLCLRFRDYNCINCPVEERTGAICCRNSPYEMASHVYKEWKSHEGHEDYLKKPRDNFRREAERELAFLESLLPEGERE